MFTAASSQCFAERTLADACQGITDLEYDKVEIWMNEESDHLKPSEVASDPERMVARFRDSTRLTPIALNLDHEIPDDQVEGIVNYAKLLRVTQLTVRSSQIGTPFNTEIDRLRTITNAAGLHGIRVSIKTERGRLTEDPHTAVEFCQSVNGLGITLDPSHYIYGYPEPMNCDMTTKHVYSVQLRDTSAESLQVQVGLGLVDYNRLINQLRNEKYNRALIVSLLPEHTDKETRALEMRKLRLLLESLL